MFACAFNLLIGFAGLLGWLFGSLAIRRTGIYFSMITLALSQMLYFVVLQVKLSSGEDGLQYVPRAISLGYDVARFKLLAFVISASLAGMAGATKTLVFQLASLSDVHWHMSGEVVLMTLLGGLGTILGPVVGAAVIVTLQNELAGRVGSWVTVITGGIFVLCVLTFRRGIVGEIKAFLERK